MQHWPLRLPLPRRQPSSKIPVASQAPIRQGAAWLLRHSQQVLLPGQTAHQLLHQRGYRTPKAGREICRRQQRLHRGVWAGLPQGRLPHQRPCTGRK